MTRDWPPEPWQAGEHVPGFGHVFAADGDELARTRGNLAYDATPAGTAQRIASVANAMKGWNAPEGAIDDLIEFLLSFDNQHGDMAGDAWQPIWTHLEKFERTEEPS